MTPARWPRWAAVAAALLGCLGVAMSAFGAHGMQSRLEEGLANASQFRGFEVAAMQHVLHALALLGTAIAARSFWASRWLAAACALFAFGILAFAGPLYLYALTGAKPLIRLVPVGGVGFVLGWAALALGLTFRPRTEGHLDDRRDAR